ncbi:MAG: hypothetical protein ABR588_06290 [Sphingomicrobium sp.]|nr:hypothetical protein [Sphingomonadales bacterium]
MTMMKLAACGVLLACAPAMAQPVQPASTTPVATNSLAARPVTAVMVQAPSAVTNGSMLQSNSEVWLSLDHELTSKKTKVGAAIPMSVSRDVMLGNYVVIPRGTPAKGHISYRTGKGAFGKSAKMEFDLDSIELPGRSVPVTGHYRIEGQGNTGAAVGAVVAVGVFGAFVTGHSATAAQGSEWKASTKEPLAITVAS